MLEPGSELLFVASAGSEGRPLGVVPVPWAFRHGPELTDADPGLDADAALEASDRRLALPEGTWPTDRERNR